MEWSPPEEFTASCSATRFNKNRFLCILRNRTEACLRLWTTVQFVAKATFSLCFWGGFFVLSGWLFLFWGHLELFSTFLWSQVYLPFDAVISVLTFAPMFTPQALWVHQSKHHVWVWVSCAHKLYLQWNNLLPQWHSNDIFNAVVCFNFI